MFSNNMLKKRSCNELSPKISDYRKILSFKFQLDKNKIRIQEHYRTPQIQHVYVAQLKTKARMT